MGRVLLDRPEPWVLDVLIKVYDTLERRVQRFGNDGAQDDNDSDLPKSLAESRFKRLDEVVPLNPG